jgi:4-aminobutyrate aminotransferase-like enzyme
MDRDSARNAIPGVSRSGRHARRRRRSWAGTVLGVEFDGKQRRDDVQAAAFAHGLLVIGCGTKTLRILPPLDVTGREIRLGADLLAEAIQAVE